jgi:hypothetical protein
MSPLACLIILWARRGEGTGGGPPISPSMINATSAGINHNPADVSRRQCDSIRERIMASGGRTWGGNIVVSISGQLTLSLGLALEVEVNGEGLGALLSDGRRDLAAAAADRDRGDGPDGQSRGRPGRRGGGPRQGGRGRLLEHARAAFLGLLLDLDLVEDCAAGRHSAALHLHPWGLAAY